MTEMQTLEIRFSGRLLAACRDKRGAVARLIYHADNDYFVVYHDVPGSEAWLEDGRSNGLTVEDIRREWPELAEAANL